jgi:oligoribonuclease NrnB/cAMP/cGMP phosphodiesterase (DHH superfamily)
MKAMFGDSADITVKYCNTPKDATAEVDLLLAREECDEYDQIFITDISIFNGTARIIDADPELKKKFVLIDHHETATELNIYRWCNILVADCLGNKYCGTSLLFGYLEHHYPKSNITPRLRDFVELVRQYDTWEWKTKYNNQRALKLNTLLSIYKRDLFIELMAVKLKVNKIQSLFKAYSKIIFNKYDEFAMQIEENAVDSYIKGKRKSLMEIDCGDHILGVVYAERNLSLLGNALCEQNPHLHAIAMISGNIISFRSIRSDVDVSKIAQDLFGKNNAGGHKAAAGTTLLVDHTLEIIKTTLKLGGINNDK